MVDRKEAIRKWKEQKPVNGAFAVRCTATGRVWVGAARNLSAAHNSYWFTLRHGLLPDKSLQEEWNAHGEAAFQFETLEKLDDDTSPLSIKDLLKEKRAQWVARLQATPIGIL